MKHKYFKFFILIFFVSFLVTGVVCAKNLQDAFKVDDYPGAEGYTPDPLDLAAGTAGFNVEARRDHLDPVFQTVIQISLGFLGVIFMMLMIYGGFLWMTDHGNEEQVKRAKDLIVAAVIGMIIVLSSYAISWFIINALSQRTLN